ncbi:hypothetical protein EBR03_09695, partial [bacterium]|nr:hypothetical protein [bacterium]
LNGSVFCFQCECTLDFQDFIFCLSLKNWELTHNVQGIEIFHGHPHPTVCTLTGALAYVVGHRGNSFLEDMVPSSVVKLLPPLPITRFTTFSAEDKVETMAHSTTRLFSRNPYNTASQVIDASILQGPEGPVLTRHMENLINNIVHFFKLSEDQKAKLDPEIMADLKVCLLTFLDISPQDERVRNQDVSIFFTNMVRRPGSTGLQNLLSIITTTTYVRTMAADTLRTYLGVQPIPDAPTSFTPPPQPKLMVQVSWLGKNHNYVPIAGPIAGAFEYNKSDHALEISKIFFNHEFNPYIIDARRGARTFTHDTLSKMTSTRGFASSVKWAHVNKISVTVINKTMLFRVILYNDIQPDGLESPESVKFGALEVIVSISSTAVLQPTVKSLQFGTDVQFSVVSITACRPIRNPDGSCQFKKFQTFHGTNADIESLG